MKLRNNYRTYTHNESYRTAEEARRAGDGDVAIRDMATLPARPSRIVKVVSVGYHYTYELYTNH